MFEGRSADLRRAAGALQARERAWRDGPPAACLVPPDRVQAKAGARLD